MNSSELIWQKEQTIEAVKAALAETLEANMTETVQVGDVISRIHTTPMEFDNLCMLRTLGPQSSGAICVATSSEDRKQGAIQILQSLSKKGALSVDTKDVEILLIQAVLKGLKVDPKTSICLPASKLANWSKIKTSRSVRFTFQVASHEIGLEIPILTNEEHHAFVTQSYGFTPSTKILVVDDSVTTRSISKRYLQTAGFWNIEEYGDGFDAWAKMQDGKTDSIGLIVADWHMPKLSGIDLLKNVRANEKFKSLPLILVTGERNIDEVKKALAAKVSGYVVKPFEAEAFFKAIYSASPEAAKKKKLAA